MTRPRRSLIPVPGRGRHVRDQSDIRCPADRRHAGGGRGGAVILPVSPCVLPIVPPYLAYMGGVSVTEMGGTARPAAGRSCAALFFVLGLSTVFLLLGFTASAFGRFFLQLRTGSSPLAGIVDHGLRGAFHRRLPHAVSGPRDAGGCRRPRRLGLWRLCAGAGLRLWLDALHRPDTWRDPGAGRLARPIWRAARCCWRSMPLGLGMPFLLVAAFFPRPDGSDGLDEAAIWSGSSGSWACCCGPSG